jgi:cleavage and polyadenylation specificity factor subunit 4
MATATAPTDISENILNPQSQSFGNRFAFHDFLRKEYRFGLDPNRRTCPLFVQGHCPMGNSCPDKHAVSSSFNKQVRVFNFLNPLLQQAKATKEKKE